jgi:hypothetical protein
MSNYIQTIRALETAIYDAVEEYITHKECYTNPRLHIWLDESDMVHKVEIIDDDIEPNNDNIYDIEDFVSVELPYKEVVNNDQVSELANKWIFLE